MMADYVSSWGGGADLFDMGHMLLTISAPAPAALYPSSLAHAAPASPSGSVVGIISAGICHPAMLAALSGSWVGGIGSFAAPVALSCVASMLGQARSSLRSGPTWCGCCRPLGCAALELSGELSGGRGPHALS